MSIMNQDNLIPMGFTQTAFPDSKFPQGICPECLTKYYPGYVSRENA